MAAEITATGRVENRADTPYRPIGMVWRWTLRRDRDGALLLDGWSATEDAAWRAVKRAGSRAGVKLGSRA